MQLTLLLAIGTGGFAGAVMRFTLSSWIQKLSPTFFPFGTLGVNILGSFLIGFAALYFSEAIIPHQKALVITGFLGALTTFSTFSYETLLMLQNGLWGRALLNASANVFLCLLATLLGMLLFKKLYGL